MKIDIPCNVGDLISMTFEKKKYVVPVRYLYIGRKCFAHVDEYEIKRKDGKECKENCGDCKYGGTDCTAVLCEDAISANIPDGYEIDGLMDCCDIPFDLIGRGKPFKVVKNG